MYIAPGQGQTTTGNKSFMSTETSCHFGHLLQVLKKSLLRSLIFYIFFMLLYMCIALGRGQKPRGDKICTIFINDFIYEYSPRTGADKPGVTI